MHLELRPLRIADDNEHLIFPDSRNEEGLFVTPVALRRIALVAAETASRFAGADTAALAMDWMDAPRPLFGGLSAMDACMDEVHCRRALTLHGLGMDPEADDMDVDLVMALDDDEVEVDLASTGAGAREECVDQAQLMFVSEISYEGGKVGAWAFGTTVLQDVGKVARVLEKRCGTGLVAGSQVRMGFDHDEGMARALVLSAMTGTLAAVAQDPRSPLARGLRVVIEPRFNA